jgi:hypothetical protein
MTGIIADLQRLAAVYPTVEAFDAVSRSMSPSPAGDGGDAAPATARRAAS